MPNTTLITALSKFFGAFTGLDADQAPGMPRVRALNELYEVYQAAKGCAVEASSEPITRTYLDRLVDRLLMPPAAMTAKDVTDLHAEAASMLHLLAARSVPATGVPADEDSQMLDWLEDTGIEEVEIDHTDKFACLTLRVPFDYPGWPAPGRASEPSLREAIRAAMQPKGDSHDE